MDLNQETSARLQWCLYRSQGFCESGVEVKYLILKINKGVLWLEVSFKGFFIDHFEDRGNFLIEVHFL